MAADAGLDLVEIAPNADPPVCKILDFGKFKYEEQKKKNEASKKQKVIEVKEIKLRPSIDDHDYEVKMRSMTKFIEEGDKVKVTMRFRGREMAHQELGMDVLMRVRGDLDDDRQSRADAAHGRPPDDDGGLAEVTAWPSFRRRPGSTHPLIEPPNNGLGLRRDETIRAASPPMGRRAHRAPRRAIAAVAEMRADQLQCYRQAVRAQPQGRLTAGLPDRLNGKV